MGLDESSCRHKQCSSGSSGLKSNLMKRDPKVGSLQDAKIFHSKELFKTWLPNNLSIGSNNSIKILQVPWCSRLIFLIPQALTESIHLFLVRSLLSKLMKFKWLTLSFKLRVWLSKNVPTRALDIEYWKFQFEICAKKGFEKGSEGVQTAYSLSS